MAIPVIELLLAAGTELALASTIGSSLSISTDVALIAVGAVVVFSASPSTSGTRTMSTSSFWLDNGPSDSNSEAGRFNGDDDLCGISSAPPMIVLCLGDLPRSDSKGSEGSRLRFLLLVNSPPLSLSIDKPA